MWDPFYTEMPLFFDMKFQDLLNEKDPHAWPDFERGSISEEQLYERFFKDRRPINGSALLNHMVSQCQNFAALQQQADMLILLLKRGCQ